MAAPTTADHVTAVTNLINFRDDSFGVTIVKPQLDLFQTGVRDLIGLLQDLHVNSADAVATAYLTDNRAFIINSSGSNQTVTFNSTDFVLADTKVYCLDPKEQTFFLENNANLTASTIGAFDNVNGVIDTFYW